MHVMYLNTLLIFNTPHFFHFHSYIADLKKRIEEVEKEPQLDMVTMPSIVSSLFLVHEVNLPKKN